MTLLNELKNNDAPTDLMEEVLFQADRVLSLQLTPTTWILLSSDYGNRVALRVYEGTYDPVMLCEELFRRDLLAMVAPSSEDLAYKIRFSAYAEESEMTMLLKAIRVYQVVYEDAPLPDKGEADLEFYLNALPTFRAGMPLLSHELATHVGLTRALIRKLWS